MKNLLPIVTSILCLMTGLFSHAQQLPLLPQDSLALVDIYNSTQGDRWIEQGGWLQGSIDTWDFVDLKPDTSGNFLRVIALNLAGNDLRGSIGNSINQLTELTILDVSNNKLTALPQTLSGLTSLNTLLCQNNRLADFPFFLGATGILPALQTLNSSQNWLTFEELFRLQTLGQQLPNLNLTILPQNNFDPPLQISAFVGDNLEFAVDDNTQGIAYEWIKDNDPNFPNPGGPILRFSPVALDDSGTYRVNITHSDFPGVTLTRNDINISVDSIENDPFPLDLRDNTGRMKVTLAFLNDTAPKDSAIQYLEDIGAERVQGDSCLCGDFSSWYLPDTLIDDSTGGYTIGGVEIISEACAEMPGQEGGNFLLHWDYPMNTIDQEYSGPQYSINLKQGAASTLSNTESPIKVAIIDLGVDSSHIAFRESIWGFDKAVACILGDTHGYNFFMGDNNPFDDITSHGTHIAGIIHNFIDDMPLELLSIQVGKQLTDARVIDVICALKYAMDHEVDVINLSMGYQGPRSDLLAYFVAQMQADKEDIVLVTSSGNNYLDNDERPFWPSNLSQDFRHVVSVGAMKEGYAHLARFSNWGKNTVSLAAPGDKILSAFAGGVNRDSLGIKSGTSMATPFVTAVVAYIRATNPGLNSYETRQLLLQPPFSIIDPSLVDSIRGGFKLDVEIKDCSDSPQPRNDYLDVKAGESLTIDVLWNDCREAGVLPTALSDPNASVNSSTGIISYQVPNDATGEITFTYDLCPLGPGTCGTATVTLRILGDSGWSCWIIIIVMLALIIFGGLIYFMLS